MIDVNKKQFAERLSGLRINKGVSARDMSLSIGQSAGYINNIENGVNYPSMQVFFYICEYLEITPAEFFETDKKDPVIVRELTDILKDIDNTKLESLINIAKALK